jgi:hypothetical protein
MRARSLVVRLLVVTLPLVLVAGCAKPPQVELDKAKAALNTAAEAEAATYAPEAWQAAQDAMNAVNAEMEVQANKFALFRSYKNTKALIVTAETAATEAEQAGRAGKEKARQEAQAALDAVRTALTDAQNMLAELDKCKRKPKGFKQDMELLQGNLDGLNASLPEVESAMSGEEFLTAKSLAEQLQQRVDTFAADIAAAKTKINC